MAPRAAGRPRIQKPFLDLGPGTVLEMACRAFDAAPHVVELVIVARAEDVERIERWCAERAAFAKVRAVVPGGRTRAESVRAGVRWCGFGVELIAVHDAARPLVAPAAIERVLAAAARHGAALLGLPVRDTLKRAIAGPAAKETLSRDGLWAAQTPQAFSARRFRAALARARDDGFEPTDDAAVWERYVGPVALVEGSSRNLKITTPDDLHLARALAAPSAAERRSR
jgi:2-C-methyl-D-erythritol 4-phosphate cytidylyltransferase